MVKHPPALAYEIGEIAISTTSLPVESGRQWKTRVGNLILDALEEQIKRAWRDLMDSQPALRTSLATAVALLRDVTRTNLSGPTAVKILLWLTDYDKDHP